MQQTIPSFLGELTTYLDGLSQRAPEDELVQRLEQLTIDAEELVPYQRYHPTQYRRNLICEGQWYDLLAICWASGQRSPIHDHAQSTCGQIGRAHV